MTGESWAIIISALALAIVQIINASRVTTKVAEVSAKADVISGHVNSSATAAAGKIDSLEKQLVVMRDMLLAQRDVAMRLAEVAAADASGRRLMEAYAATPPTPNPAAASAIRTASEDKTVRQQIDTIAHDVKAVKAEVKIIEHDVKGAKPQIDTIEEDVKAVKATVTEPKR